jgi:hypothetical protein
MVLAQPNVLMSSHRPIYDAGDKAGAAHRLKRLRDYLPRATRRGGMTASPRCQYRDRPSSWRVIERAANQVEQIAQGFEGMVGRLRCHGAADSIAGQHGCSRHCAPATRSGPTNHRELLPWQKSSVRRYSRSGAKLLIQPEAFRVGDLFIGGHAGHVRAGSSQCPPLLDVSAFQIEVVLKWPPVVLRLVSG